MDGILSAQRLDVHDIEGIYRVYEAVIARGQQAADRPRAAPQQQCLPVAASRELLPSAAASQDDCTGEEGTGRQSVSMLPPAEQLAVLRDYLTASTAKDCSVMIALQASQPVHLRAASTVMDHPDADARSAPAIGRLATADGSFIAFKVQLYPWKPGVGVSCLACSAWCNV